MTGWRLAQVKARNLAIEGHCQSEGCGHFYAFDVDQLIAAAGTDFELPEFIPGVTCTQCGGRLKVYLAAIPPEQNGTDAPQ